MSWYLRKSVKLGPARLNLSKSGIGASFGVKGARVSIGPRGTYLHAGRGGIYFRERIGGRRSRPAGSTPVTGPIQEYHDIHEIRTAGAAHLVDAANENLLHELRIRHRRIALAPWAGIAAAILCAIIVYQATQTHWLYWLLAVIVGAIGVFATVRLRSRDIERKTVNLNVELDAECQANLDLLADAMRELAGCSRIWRLITKRGTDDWKRHGGATNLVSRNDVSVGSRLPPYVKSNFIPYAISTKSQTLYFMPERILVYEGREIGSVPYVELEILADTTRFIETGSIPKDAEVVDTTWQYVNKKGGPDRRFKDNRQIPVCRYGELVLRSSTGMHFQFQTSKATTPQSVKRGVEQMRELHVREDQEPETIPHEVYRHPDTPAFVEVLCPTCLKRFRARTEFIGQIARCNGCGAAITISAGMPQERACPSG